MAAIPALVEFHLQEIAGGTLLAFIESESNRLPSERYIDAFRMNSRGWEQQLKSIEAYVLKRS